MSEASLHSIQLGTVTECTTQGSDEWWDKSWTTSFHKKPVSGRVWLGYETIKGDEQADRRVHGGVDRAICVYALEHYTHWRDSLARPDMGPGAFGENFTTSGLLEDDLCIGDVFSVGEAVVQVSQPRQPCWKLARRWRIKDLAAQVERNGRTGFYFRVLKHGWVQAGDGFQPQERPFPALTLSHANNVMHHAFGGPEAARELAACPLLAGSWKDELWARAARMAAAP